MPVAAIAAETLFVPDLTLAREHLAITIIPGGLVTTCQRMIGKFCDKRSDPFQIQSQGNLMIFSILDLICMIYVAAAPGTTFPLRAGGAL